MTDEFYKSTLNIMNNNRKTFNGSIEIIEYAKDDISMKYKMYATNQHTHFGRKYIALPTHVQLTDQVIRQYNIMSIE